MLNQEQIEIADFLLQHLLANNGMATKDSYPPALEKRGFSKLVTTTVISFLTDRELIAFIEPDKYWLKLLPPGYEAAKIGIAKYLGNEKSDKELDRKQKFASIKSVRYSSVIGIFGLLLAIFSLINQYHPMTKRQAERDQRNNEGSPAYYFHDSNFQFKWVDTTFLKVIKDSLKHDQEFLNEIKILIEK